MKTLTIHNIPEDLMDIMERRASANDRPVEEEALLWLQGAERRSALPGVPAVMRKRTPEEIAEIDRKWRRLNARLPMIYTDDDEVNRYKREGRL